MFNFTHSSYIKYAFPADELNPSACLPVDKKVNSNILGNYSLTLINSLDTFAVDFYITKGFTRLE